MIKSQYITLFAILSAISLLAMGTLNLATPTCAITIQSERLIQLISLLIVIPTLVPFLAYSYYSKTDASRHLVVFLLPFVAFNVISSAQRHHNIMEPLKNSFSLISVSYASGNENQMASVSTNAHGSFSLAGNAQTDCLRTR